VVVAPPTQPNHEHMTVAIGIALSHLAVFDRRADAHLPRRPSMLRFDPSM
jgi:hypothetical protein